MSLISISPFKFNIWKHHLPEGIALLNELKTNNQTELFFSELETLGDNLVDVYIDKLSASQITNQIKNKLISENHFEYNDYKMWLAGNEFKKITLDDNSVWVLRLGFKKEFYIHIHPGKHSPHTFRTNSNSLKTSFCYYYKYNNTPISTEKINNVKMDKGTREQIASDQPAGGHKHNFLRNSMRTDGLGSKNPADILSITFDSEKGTWHPNRRRGHH